MKDLGALMKQAQAMQGKLQAAQARLAETQVLGVAGGGAVTVTLTGAGELKAVVFDDGVLQPDEADIIGDLIVAAHADAKRQLDALQADLMKDVAGPLGGAIPGLKF